MIFRIQTPQYRVHFPWCPNEIFGLSIGLGVKMRFGGLARVWWSDLVFCGFEVFKKKTKSEKTTAKMTKPKIAERLFEKCKIRCKKIPSKFRNVSVVVDSSGSIGLLSLSFCFHRIIPFFLI